MYFTCYKIKQQNKFFKRIILNEFFKRIYLKNIFKEYI